MTISFTLTPLFPLLSLALVAVSMAATAWSACLLAVLAFCGRRELLRTVSGWPAVTCALVSATLLSTGTWQFGVLFAVLAAGCGVLWRRERKRGKERG